MAEFYAQPYDVDATEFYFSSIEEYDQKRSALRNAAGDPVEEFEIQFIDGDELDCELAKAASVNQANLSDVLEWIEEWDDWKKTTYILAVGEGGYCSDSDPDQINIDIYEVDSMKELGEQFVEEGLFGDVPERIRFYLDYDLIARDLSVDYSEAEIAGTRYVYRLG